MKSWTKPTDELVDKALASINKVTARKYFFSRLENPLWLQPLIERGRFKYPPKARRFDDGTIGFPYWPEMRYLKNVCTDLPNEVIDLVINLPKVDNPVVYDGILDIALQLPGEYSVKLKDKILEYAGMGYQHQTNTFANLLTHWTTENQTAAALELTEILIVFVPDPQSENKQKRRKEDSINFATLLYPTPRIEPWIYRRIMSKGVRRLAKSEPYKVARLLIDATVDMIRLRTHQENLDKKEDYSDAWCKRIHEEDNEHADPEKTLVHTLTFACEKVFEKSPDAIVDLDKVLQKQQWNIFKRLRHHLYAQYPNEQTKPWIRELILTHEDYGLWEHRYEFQQMVRCACEHFGETLLTKKERTRIFDAILDGPSKENYRRVERWLRGKFTEEGFQERQQGFHRMQLRPFESVLFGKYETRFKKLQDKINKPISDEDYPPFKNEVNIDTVFDTVSHRSPRTSEDLSNLTDEDLLAFMNEWEKIDKHFEGDTFVEINIAALANAFQTVFKESIIPDPNRLQFWMANRGRIERPIYVRMMIYAMEALIKEKNFDQLNEWLTFSEWVLSHPDQEHKRDYKQDDESRENKNWTNARRAVGDFIGVCLAKDVDVPITVREQLTKILKMLCTQSDWNLDESNPNRLYRKDPLTEGINSTRSCALEDLVKFGYWLRRHEPECEVPEVTTILEKRFTSDTGYPLTPPEYAILGKNYLSIYILNEEWAIEHKSDFFPQTQSKRQEWYAAFSSFVLCNGAVKPLFEILKDDFNFALQHLYEFEKHDHIARQPIDVFGERLFNYYLWEMFPLKGQESLLEHFYQKTDEEREHWGNLFNDIGQRLRNTGKNLDPNMKDRVQKFFEWRFEQKESKELQHFTSWLETECLDAKWRLDAYSKILDICEVEDWEIYLRELRQMLPKHTAEVVECFAKLTDGIHENIYMQTEEAKTILKAGLNSTDKDIVKNAERALDNLLRAGRTEFMDLAI